MATTRFPLAAASLLVGLLASSLIGPSQAVGAVASPDALTAVAGDSRYINLAWHKSAADDGTFTYRVFRDGLAIGPWKKGTKYVDRPAFGRHVYQARAMDGTGHIIPFSVSVTAWAVSRSELNPSPPQPADLEADAGSAGEASLEWQAGEGGSSKTTSYRVFRDGIAIASVGSLAFEDFRAGRPAGTVDYTVQAVDAEGYESAMTDPVSVDVNPSQYSWAGIRWFSGPTNKPQVALTFDDCYDGAVIKLEADILRANNAHATFFCTGAGAAHNVDVLANVARDFPVGNHTYNHPDLNKLTDAQVLTELKKATSAIEAATGRPLAPIMRAPYGHSSASVRADAGSLGLAVIKWNIDTNDWRGWQTTAGVVSEALKATNGSIVIMHDKAKTAAALQQIIDGLRARGYQLVSVPEMLGIPWQPAERDY